MFEAVSRACRVRRVRQRYAALHVAGALVMAVLLLPASQVCARTDDVHDDAAWPSVGSRITWTRVAGIAAVTAWGVAQWDYFERAPHSTQEGWFEADSANGGADKLGHLYASYVMARALADLYEHWGARSQTAGREAALTTVLVTGVMEVGDSFSPTYGFSAEDFLMNLAGALLGYALYTHPDWRHRLDLRIEYLPRGDDPFTDYERTRYLAALRLDGFAGLQRTPLRWLELHAGYYARGYDSPAPDVRTLYLGLGFNFSRAVRAAGFPRSARLFNYWQPPDSTLALRHRLSP